MTLVEPTRPGRRRSSSCTAAALVVLCLAGATACSSDGEGAESVTSTTDGATREPNGSDRSESGESASSDGGPAPDPADGRRAEDLSSADVPGTTGVPGTGDEPSTPPPTAVPPEAIDDGIAVPDGDEPMVLGPLGSTEIELDTGDGTVQIGAADVPDLIPAAFPRPADLVVQIASGTEASAGFTGVSRLEFDELVQLYREGLLAAGYELLDDTVTPGSLAVFAFDGPDSSGDVVLSTPAPGGGTSVIVTFDR